MTLTVDFFKAMESIELNIDIYDFGPPRRGVYFLLDQGCLQYIGKSIDADSRLRSHRNNSKIPFDQVLFVDILDENILNDVEDGLIRYFKPKYNGDRTKAKKIEAEDLRKILKNANSFKKYPNINLTTIKNGLDELRNKISNELYQNIKKEMEGKVIRECEKTMNSYNNKLDAAKDSLKKIKTEIKDRSRELKRIQSVFEIELIRKKSHIDKIEKRQNLFKIRHYIPDLVA